MTAGQSAFGAVKFSGAAKAKRRRHYPWLTRRSLTNRHLTLAPRRTCCFAPNTCSSLPWWLGFIPGLPGIGKSEHDGSAVKAVKFSGAAKAKRHRPYPWYPPFIGQESPCPRAELLLCAKHLFVAAMMAGVHPGLPRIGKSGHDGGASAFGAGEVFQGSKSKAPPSSPAGALLPPVLRFVIPRQRFVHGSHGVDFPLPG